MSVYFSACHDVARMVSLVPVLLQCSLCKKNCRCNSLDSTLLERLPAYQRSALPFMLTNKRSMTTEYHQLLTFGITGGIEKSKLLLLVKEMRVNTWLQHQSDFLKEQSQYKGTFINFLFSYLVSVLGTFS